MNTLFPDSETISKHRPTKATDAQLQAFYKEYAEEIIENGWAVDDLEDVVHDVSNISSYDSGYEIAKSLEGYGSRGSYDIDTSFIEFLDDFSWRKQELLDNNVKLWAQAHNIQPKFSKGQKLIVEQGLNREYVKGCIVYVNGFSIDRACYWIDQDKERNGGTVLAYEKVEAACSPQRN